MSIYINGKKIMEEINKDWGGSLDDLKSTQIDFANDNNGVDDFEVAGYPTSTYGKILVLGGTRPTQLFFPHPDYNSHVYWRQSIDGQTYSKWHTLAAQEDIDSLQSQIDDLKKKIGGVNKHDYLPYLKEVVA